MVKRVFVACLTTAAICGSVAPAQALYRSDMLKAAYPYFASDMRVTSAKLYNIRRPQLKCYSKSAKVSKGFCAGSWYLRPVPWHANLRWRRCGAVYPMTSAQGNPRAVGTAGSGRNLKCRNIKTLTI